MHESIARFIERYALVVHALEELKSSSKHETAKTAHQFLSVVLALNTTAKFFSLTLPLCNTQLKVDSDLSECCSFVTCVLQVCEDMCANAEAEFILFKASQQMTNAAGGADITMPRTAGRMVVTIRLQLMQLSITAAQCFYRLLTSCRQNLRRGSLFTEM